MLPVRSAAEPPTPYFAKSGNGRVGRSSRGGTPRIGIKRASESLALPVGGANEALLRALAAAHALEAEF